MNNYNDLLAMISSEFHRYLMENEDFAKRIAANALIVFQIDGEEDFNRWHKEISLKNREEGQPLIYVSVKKWRSHSTIEEICLPKIA